MERATSLLSLSSRSSSRGSNKGSRESTLPFGLEKRRRNFRTLLGHSLYRRVLIWTIVSLVLVLVVLCRGNDGPMASVVPARFGALMSAPQVANPEGNGPASLMVGESRQGAESRPKPEAVAEVKDGKTEEKEHPNKEEGQKVAERKNEQEKNQQKKNKAPLWLKFPHLDGYFHGLKALVKKSKHIAEYPNPDHQAPLGKPSLRQEVPKPRPYSPYDSSDSIQTCYLDPGNKIPAPSIYAYDGVPQHTPDPAIGSYDVLGIRDDVCFDRFGRYGPYGYGYSIADGGSGMGMDTENSKSDEVWSKSGRIKYEKMDWGDAQDRCLARNRLRFKEPDPETEKLISSKGKKGRVAIVVRLFSGFKWTELVVINFRALITEVSLRSGGEYTVHFLLHVRDGNLPIWADDVTVQRVLDANVPTEFHGLITLWSEPQMILLYPGSFEDVIKNPSGQGFHGVYRSGHLPLQMFARQHPEYEHYWNWEMDMRYLGNWYELFDRIGRWADKQPRALLWEKSARYYIPAYHGPWENFTASVQQQVTQSGKASIFGPVEFPGRKPLRHEQRGESAVPDTCAAGPGQEKCGVDEPADLVTLNPIFEVNDSAWFFSDDVTGYGPKPGPPRRSSIIAASRLSRRLLLAMHEEIWRNSHSMFTEMFPPSMALHHGYKAVYAPHPVFLDRAWKSVDIIDAAFNGGHDHSSSGSGSPFALSNEHMHKGTSWYYHSEFAGLLWRRWMGYAQLDGRANNKARGGKDEEESEESSGRMCLRSTLLHPIKYESPSELDR